MTTIAMPVKTSVTHRLLRLAHLFETGQASPLMEQTLNKLFAHETEHSRLQLSELEADLGVFERQYGMTSPEFYRRYQAGQTDDRMDFVEWASLVQMAANLRRRLEALTDSTAP